MNDKNLNIDLKGIEDKWSKTGRSICAQCGRDFDGLNSEDLEEEDGTGCPLQLFRGKGKKTEMLTLCWECAEPRMEGTEYPCYGICCRCGEQRGLRNIVNLPYKRLTPGHGWGCFVCNLPMEGMIAMLCDECALRSDCLESNLKFICSDYAAHPGRTPWAEVKDKLVPHNHDMAYHQDTHPTN